MFGKAADIVWIYFLVDK